MANAPHKDIESKIEANPVPFAIGVILIGVLSVWAMSSLADVVRVAYSVR